jgi:hypothetical protein
MSTLALNAFVTKTLLDDKFQKDILNGERLERINEFDLSNDEKKAILSIQADNVKQFIHEVNQWMSVFEISQSAASAKVFSIPDAEKIPSPPQTHCERDSFHT